MIWFSWEHDRGYRQIVSELLQYGGYDGQTHGRLSAIAKRGGCTSDYEAEWVDKMYREYGDRGVIE